MTLTFFLMSFFLVNCGEGEKMGFYFLFFTNYLKPTLDIHGVVFTSENGGGGIAQLEFWKHYQYKIGRMHAKVSVATIYQFLLCIEMLRMELKNISMSSHIFQKSVADPSHPRLYRFTTR